MLYLAPAGRGAHPVQVGASAEDRAFTGKHQHARPVVGLHARETVAQRVDQLPVECVTHLGPVEPDTQDGTVTRDVEHSRYILNTPNVVSGMGALSAAAIPSASTWRVSTGSITPSSQRR